ELEAGAAEGIGLHEVRAGVEIPLVDAAHDVGVRVVPQVRAGPVEQAGVEERGPVTAVEDEELTGLDPRDDLPAGTLRHFQLIRMGGGGGRATPPRSAPMPPHPFGVGALRIVISRRALPGVAWLSRRRWWSPWRSRRRRSRPR